VTLSDWIYALLLVLATAISRSTLVVMGARLRLPPRVDSALRFAPACALAAILAPQLLLTPAQNLVAWHDMAPVWAALATGITMMVSRSMVAAIGLGMAAFWLLS
jgi:branched-subunit amino acid transport protein